MKTAKEPKVKLTLSAGQLRKGKTNKHFSGEDYGHNLGKDDNPEVSEFRNALSYQLMGCAKGPLSQLTDDQIKDMMVLDRYGL